MSAKKTSETFEISDEKDLMQDAPDENAGGSIPPTALKADPAGGTALEEGAIPDADTALESMESQNDEETEATFKRQDSVVLKENPDAAQKAEELSTIFSRKRVITASEKEKQTLYREGREEVRLFGETNLVTQPAARKEEFLRLSHAKNQSPLEGEIIGVIDNPYMPIAKVRYASGTFNISIPATYLCDFDEQILASAEGRSRVLNELNHRIGGKISFIPFEVNEVSGTVYASRINAMDYYGRANFINLRQDGKPMLFAGIKTNARVVAVHRNNVTVEVGGVECSIPREELSWTPLESLNHEFAVGDEFMVKILSVARYSTTKGNKITLKNMIKLYVSKKQAETNPNRLYFDNFEVEGTYSGEVKYITPGVIHVLLGNVVGIICPVPHFAASREGDLPVKGQRCLVRITNKEAPENGSGDYRITGRIINYFPPSR